MGQKLHKACDREHGRSTEEIGWGGCNHERKGMVPAVSSRIENKNTIQY